MTLPGEISMSGVWSMTVCGVTFTVDIKSGRVDFQVAGENGVVAIPLRFTEAYALALALRGEWHPLRGSV